MSDPTPRVGEDADFGSPSSPSNAPSPSNASAPSAPSNSPTPPYAAALPSATPPGNPSSGIPSPDATAAPARRWSGKKTAVVAAVAVSLGAVGAVGAAAAIPRVTGSEIGRDVPGQFGRQGGDHHGPQRGGPGERGHHDRGTDAPTGGAST